ncbi:MAG: hypothetical protein ACK5PP_09860 [Acidimicrobiales bacterium]
MTAAAIRVRLVAPGRGGRGGFADPPGFVGPVGESVGCGEGPVGPEREFGGSEGEVMVPLSTGAAHS